MCFVLCCLEIILKGICFIIFLFEKEVFLIVLPPPPCNLETDILFDFLNFIDQRQGHFHIDDVNNIISNKADRLTKFTMKRKILFKLLVKSLEAFYLCIFSCVTTEKLFGGGGGTYKLQRKLD